MSIRHTLTASRILDFVTGALMGMLVVIFTAEGEWLRLLAPATTLCWLAIAHQRLRTNSILRNTIQIQQQIIDGQRQTMDRMVGPYAQMTRGEGPS